MIKKIFGNEKGRLIGFCIACDYDINETEKYLKIKLRSGVTILTLNKDEFRE